MNWMQIGTVAVAVFIICLSYKQRGNIKQLMEGSEEAPQYWGTYVGLMLMVLALLYLLIKL